MTRDKEGSFIFKKGGTYTMKVFVNPIWTPGVKSTCLETREYDGKPNRQGLFTLGDDTRWWTATEQFDEA